MTFRRLLAAAVLAVPLALTAATFAATPPDDSFIAGYAAAVMERELSMKADGLTVSGGHITFTGPSLAPADRAQLIKVLSSIPGVKDVTIPAGAPAVPAAKPLEPVTTGTPPTTGPSNAVSDGAISLQTDPTPLTLYLGAGRTFAPLLADPRWPHFFASYNHYDRDRSSANLKEVGSVGFGETIAFLKQAYPSGFRWEAGIQAGLFAIFDLDSESKDLINADYFVGPYFAVRQGDFSLMARLFHQSSHLGDEFLLGGDAPTRENTSYETINLLLSYDLPEGFRIYGGGGYLFDTDPSDTEPWTIQYGVEWVSPRTIFGTNWIRPVAAFDGQNREDNDWNFSYSLRAGVQLEDPSRFTQRLQIMLEYYDGNSPNGQFYDEHIRFYGIGAHFYF